MQVYSSNGMQGVRSQIIIDHITVAYHKDLGPRCYSHFNRLAQQQVSVLFTFIPKICLGFTFSETSIDVM